METTEQPDASFPFHRSALVIVLLAIAACGGDDLLLPSDGAPARIAVFSGNNQTATVGQPLGEDLVAEVTDPAGRPVPGVEVLFVPPEGGVLAPEDRVVTDRDGHAAVQYTLSSIAGDQMVEARAPIEPASNSTTSFRVAAQPEGPEALMPVGGDEQSAQVSTVLPESVAVKAVDRFGNGVPGVEVTWESSGGGDVSPTSVITGADGRAATARILGERPGSYGTVAKAEGLDGSPVSFTATGIAPPRPELVLVTQPSSSAAAGVPLERQPEIQLQDPLGAPLSQEDVSVTVQIARGGGSLGGTTTAESDATGHVRFTNLEFHGGPGSKTLIFAADGFTTVTSSEIAVRPGPPSPDQSSVSVPNGTAGATTVVTVRLRDEFGNAISDASDHFSISVTGANPTSPLPVIDNGNGSYSASYVPVHSGTDAVAIEFKGAPLGAGSYQSVVSPGAADPTTTQATISRRAIFFIDVVVTTLDAQGNLLGHGGDLVQVELNGVAQPVVDMGNGTYTTSFVADFGWSVAILLNGVPIAGSPFGT